MKDTRFASSEWSRNRLESEEIPAEVSWAASKLKSELDPLSCIISILILLNIFHTFLMKLIRRIHINISVLGEHFLYSPYLYVWARRHLIGRILMLATFQELQDALKTISFNCCSEMYYSDYKWETGKKAWKEIITSDGLKKRSIWRARSFFLLFHCWLWKTAVRDWSAFWVQALFNI